MSTQQDLFAIATAWQAAKPTSLKTLGAIMANDGKLFDRLRDGGRVWPETVQKCLQNASDNWPEGAVWPDHIQRPASSEAA